MAISQLPQAPYRQDRKLFPTPLVGDVLFSEVRDCNRSEFPEYGTPHPNAKKWPDHRLVFIKSVDIERDGIFEFFYAADRENQDQYNYAYTQGELALTRTYIIARDQLADFTEPKAGQSDPTFPEYKFATQQLQRVEDKELDSLYVAVQRIYSKQGVVTAVDTETKTGYKIRRVTTIEKASSESGNSSSNFGDKGWTNRQESVQVTGGTVSSTIEQRPFVKIQSDATISATPELPETGVGSSKLIYDNGETKVYENVNDTSTAKTGPAGVEKESRPYAIITTDKEYSTSNTVTAPTGASQVVFNDGETTVYEISNITAQPQQRKVGEEKEARPYANISTAKRYSVNSSVATNTGSSNIVWTDGATTIYEVNEVTATAKPGTAGTEKEERPYASLSTAKKYDTTGTVNTKTGSSNIVWTDGVTTIYEVNEITATAKPGTTGVEKEQRPYASLNTTKKYATTGDVNTNTGSSSIVWTDGVTTIYEVNEITAIAKPAEVGQEKEERPYASLNTAKRYSTSSAVGTRTGSSNVVWTDGVTTIYEVNEITANAKIQQVGEEKDERPYASLKTAKRYSTNSTVNTKTGSSNVVWTDGVTTIYEVNEVTASAKSGAAGTAGEEKDERPYASLKTAKRYSTNSTVNAKTGSSNVVWTDGVTTIYEVNEITATAKTPTVGEEKDERPYASLKTTKKYATSGDVNTKTGSSSIVWTDGSTTIYEVNEVSATAKTSTAGEEKDERPYASLKTTKRYATSGDVNTKTGSSSIVWTDGSTTIYEVNEVTAAAKSDSAGEEKDERPYASLKTTKRYATSGNVNTKTGSSSVVWTDGSTTIYEVSEISATPKTATAGEEKERRPYVELTTKKRYATSQQINTKTGSSNIVWTDGSTTIYEINEITPVAQTSNKPGFDFRVEPWGCYKIDKKYVSQPNESNQKLGQTSILYTDGNVNVYEETVATISKVNGTQYTSAKSLRDGPYIEETKTKYIKAADGSGISSSVDYYTVTEVFSDGSEKVFRLDELKLTNNPFEWDEIINYEWPTVLKRFYLKPWKSRITGESVYYPRYDFKQGFSGPQKATKKQYWQKTKPTVVAPPKLIPEGISFRSPLFTVDIPPCLHQAITLSSSNSNKDPEWEWTLDTETYKATTPADWPASIKWVEATPHKGGYLVTETEIKKPEIT
jgi:hypothetical protein